MSQLIDKIEKEFEYLTIEEIASDSNFPKLRGGVMLTELQFSRFERLAQKLDVKESAILGEIIKRFITKHFQAKDTVSRKVYETTVTENNELTSQVEQLVKIVETLKGENAELKNNRSSGGWPTTPANNTANVSANQPAVNSANNPANVSANGYAQASANRFAYGSANGYAQNPAVSAENPATDQLIYQCVCLFVYFNKLRYDTDINPQEMYAWIRQNIR